jgi:hypothetical protein
MKWLMIDNCGKQGRDSAAMLHALTGGSLDRRAVSVMG